MNGYGMLRVATLTPKVHVGNPHVNAEAILEAVQGMGEGDALPDVVVTPELGITGYTCGDLFFQQTLLDEAWQAVLYLADRLPGSVVTVVGLPIQTDGAMYNCAAVLSAGKVVGLVPKQYPPNYKEFYELRHWHPADGTEPKILKIGGEAVPFGIDLLFRSNEVVIGVEICEDLWTPLPPSGFMAVAGANILLNLSASNEVVGKADYRRQLVEQQSARCIAGYLYCSAGPSESTSDVVFGGHNLIAENGRVLVQAERFRRDTHCEMADIDIGLLQSERRRTTSFAACRRSLPRQYREVEVKVKTIRVGRDLHREVPASPFVPSDPTELAARCDDVVKCQVHATATRLEHVFPGGVGKVHIGISGGLDSTLALLVAVHAADLLGWDRRQIVGTTMPGFGTTGRTKGNAERLMAIMNVSSRQIDIREAAYQKFRMLGHHPFGLRSESLSHLEELMKGLPSDATDLVFENVQARERTAVLMDSGFVIGTGDMSELALGWCTYNGDHMSMYNPNAGIPKTLVSSLVRHFTRITPNQQFREVLTDILNTPISPELLPTSDGKATQTTEGSVGPYELHDFFLSCVVRYGYSPEKTAWLAEHAAFGTKYSPSELRGWLSVFLKRFFANQFKRNCVPDGPKVGSISMSPRGDLRMPSDADRRLWVDRDRVEE